MLGCGNDTGQTMPSLIIFQAKQINRLWMRGEIPGTRYGLSDSGWTDRGLFYGWLEEHFLAHAVSNRPLLLLVDGHSSHYDPESISFAKDHSVIILCLPPHTTHEAQPLDVSFFGPLKKHWSQECHNFIQASPGKVVTRFNFSELFSKAWSKACSPENICSGFRRAGVVPFSPESLMKRIPNRQAGVENDRGGDIPLSSGTDPGEESGFLNNSTESQMDTSEYGDGSVRDDNLNNSTCPMAIPMFSREEEELFSRRFEEGYDLQDERYNQWLSVNHSHW